ncbi:acetyltransferase (GNAT) family protein [Tamaricihabitans halophyticus]|uniref:Acetyltransferase (GNAT) family protein n=1 Tax=Tamaricihabitans halophyticus TaxID=1262583 RepID=A0A4R2R0S1_9PSEU|nr:GNAT family N-acetyltransferase [Tamaricihabitans halophyticus]TCP56240.1 acetyltransferase (GNAT) family protein [Tamaricihabitans halophyticus]
MDENLQLEHECADAWPALVERPLGEWRMRAADGFTGRANSTLAAGDPGMPVEDALDEVIAFAVDHGITPATQVVRGTETEQAIEKAEWVVNVDHPAGAEVAVLTSGIETFAEPEAAEGVSVDPMPSAQWWQLAAGAPEPSRAQRQVLGTGRNLGFGSAWRDGQVVAAVRGAVVGDLLHIASLSVLPEYRRDGIATNLLGSLGQWATERGATRCAAQVAVHNTPALELWQTLGCAEHHRYRYWKPGN